MDILNATIEYIFKWESQGQVVLDLLLTGKSSKPPLCRVYLLASLR